MSFTTLGAWLTTFLNGYVNSVVATLAAALAPLALVLLTIYVASYGYAVARGEVSEPLGVFGWKMIKMSFVLALSLGSGLYISLISSSITGLQDGMATVFISGGAGGAFAGGAPATAFGALDAANASASALLNDLWKDAGILRLDLFLAGFMFSLGLCVLLLVGGVVTLMAKMFMAFALAIGPVAILCLMFKPSAKFFDAWLSVAMSSAVLSWFVFFALGLALFINDELVKTVAASGAFSAVGTVSVMKAAVSGVVIYGLLAVLLWQAPSLASALTGGPALRSGAGMAMSYVAGRSQGASGATRGGGAGAAGGTVVPGGGAGAAAGATASGARMAYQKVSGLFNGGRR